ncbi:MAG TPA: hypothetical protein VEL76_18410 [Gemmataceae bacterium]|nr:hypothetical protein [Gemmataceae bacterium]
MRPIKHYPLRKVAENVLVKYLGDLDAAVKDELATSLVRQWLTNNGHAGFVTPTRQFWFQMVTQGDGVEVGFSPAEGNWGRVLSDDWHVAKEEIPGLLHRLNLCQSVLCRTPDGRTIRLRIDPKERAVRCEEQSEEEVTDP